MIIKQVLVAAAKALYFCAACFCYYLTIQVLWQAGYRGLAGIIFGPLFVGVFHFVTKVFSELDRLITDPKQFNLGE